MMALNNKWINLSSINTVSAFIDSISFRPEQYMRKANKLLNQEKCLSILRYNKKHLCMNKEKYFFFSFFYFINVMLVLRGMNLSNNKFGLLGKFML